MPIAESQTTLAARTRQFPTKTETGVLTRRRQIINSQPGNNCPTRHGTPILGQPHLRIYLPTSLNKPPELSSRVGHKRLFRAEPKPTSTDQLYLSYDQPAADDELNQPEGAAVRPVQGSAVLEGFAYNAVPVLSIYAP